ncbi:MAG: secretin N-terminal domain-containing protein [Stellaceae bacterium]
MTLLRFWGIGASLGVALLAVGCDRPIAVDTALQSIPTFNANTPHSAQTFSSPTVVAPARGQETVAAGPTPPGASVAAPSVAPSSSRIPLKSTVETLTLEQVTLPNFINEVFSKTLNLTVQIDQRVMTRTDVVTLRTGSPLPSEELFRMAEKVLAGYGVGITWDGSVLHIAPDDALMAELPDLIRSRALPEMPVALRPVFQIVDLHQVSAADMASWLTDAYGAKVKVFPAAKIAAVMVFGLPENVRAAVEAISALDQARLAGRQSLRVGLVFWTAQALAAKLADVLRAEGYDVGIATGGQPGATATVMLIPVETNNTLLAFAADPKILGHVRQWVTDLDQAGRADPLRGIFVYLVQNTTAASLGQVVQAALGGQVGAGQPTTEVPLERAGATRASTLQNTTASGTAAPPAGATPASASGGIAATPSPSGTTTPQLGGQSLDAGSATGPGPAPRLVIDQARNALVFVGTAQDYQRIRPLLETLDRAPREALIEVTVAELDLTDQNALGLDWTQVNKFAGKVQSVGTGPNVIGSAGIPLGTSGFNYVLLNGDGDVRVILNAFADNNHVSVLSTPRVLAESGSEARIDVGTQVPVVTSQASTNTIQNNGTTGILQSIDYRNTGVLLSVRPVIHSGNRIELNVSQEVSAALPNNTPGISTPLIQNRNIATDLTLSDGQTVMIGGMIAENRNTDDSGVPYLKDVPGVGLFFRNQQQTRQRTELLVFITPYVISSDADASAITDQFRNQMKAWPVPNTNLHW